MAVLHDLLNQGEERGSAGREEGTSTQRRKGKDEGGSERDGKVFLMLFSSFFFFFFGEAWMYFLIQGFMRQIYILKINPTLFSS